MNMTENLNFIVLDTVASTNRFVAENMGDAPHGTVVMAREQTAGRGQRGNSWEAAPGMNVTMSIVLRPESLDVARQWRMSQAVSVGAAKWVCGMLPDVSGSVSLKWPNDLYVDDCKIGGILIENSLDGRRIRRAIVGIGLNVNQAAFFSDAPNPVSLAMLTSRSYDVESAARSLAASMIGEFRRCERGAGEWEESLDRDYLSMLWHRTGFHQFIDAATGERFMAGIDGVEPEGPLRLRLSDGSLRSYAFKEVVQPV